MKAPRPSFTPSRLNVGAYAVRVKGFVWQSVMVLGFHPDLGRYGWKAKLEPFCTLDEHLATSEGLEIRSHSWHERHYRRAVMRGAGVYQAGLWAFLATRRSFTFTAPAPGESVEPYRVRIEGEAVAHVRGRILYPVSRAEAVKMRGSWTVMKRGLIASRMTARGTVKADGSLDIQRNSYRTAHFRRVMLRGAGVYLAGLWAHLAARRTPDAQCEGGAVLGVNDAGTLARFSLAAHGRVRHSVRWRTAFKRRAREAFKGLQWAYIGRGMGNQPQTYTRSGRPRHFSRRGWARRRAANQALYRSVDHWCNLFPSQPLDMDDRPWNEEALQSAQSFLTAYRVFLRRSTEAAASDGVELFYGAYSPSLCVWASLLKDRESLRGFLKVAAEMRKQRGTLASILTQLHAQGDAYRAHLARRVKAQRLPVRLPRPLHTQPRPPAAPLAPPAL